MVSLPRDKKRNELQDIMAYRWFKTEPTASSIDTLRTEKVSLGKKFSIMDFKRVDMVKREFEGV